MAGRQAPRRTSLNWDESDTDEDKEEIDKVKAKLSETLQAKEGTPNVRRKLVSRSYQIFLQNMLQTGQKTFIYRNCKRWLMQLRRMLPDVQIPQKPHLVEHGQAVECPYFEGTFIAKDTDVEGFVQRIRDKVKPAPGRPSCGKSNFKAGREATRKSEARLDEEGMMTSVCRHCILFSGLNMFRGEIFAYPLYLQQDLGKEHKIEFVCTDVMCKYYPYIQRVEWSGRNQEGAGRTDMITIHARGWNLRKKQNLHRYLSQRYVKTKKRTDEMDKDIQNLQTKLQTTEEGMKQWVKEVEEWAASSPKSHNCQDQQGLQRVMEGLALKIKQRKIELYRNT
ncbi:hypothetical protein JOQ06_011588 [Pogonophryne albipinna]|uniref:Uncharacterized protein n=1 Tax=Pogonophryne albipinna TaxID=1090488 RepID=A0AAD6BBN1_9TELE|nr:hypothetical protein JOQ06_011588 [Pogonophryne albipinna]